MTNSYVVNQISQLHPFMGGKALDIGAGKGDDARALLELGYDVEIVEPQAANFTYPPSIKVISRSVQEIEISEATYSVIITKNVLPFMPSIDILRATVSKTYKALIPGGIMYFSVFGERDEWRNLTLVSAGTLSELEKSIGPEVLWYSEEYGLVPTLNGKLKVGHIYKNIWRKFIT